MNNFFLVALIIYLITVILIGVFDFKKIKSFTDFSVAGKNQNAFAVVMTLLATVVGASTTIGITDTVYKIGFPGIWWLAFGALGLILQSVFLSEKVRRINADTLPDLAGKIVGRPAEMLISLIIVISWVGVIAGQLAAMKSIITLALGRDNKAVFLTVVVIVILYTAIGGQMSVVRTDRLQLIIIITGVAAILFYLYFVKGGNTLDVINNIELLNADYKTTDLFNQLFVIGGVYFLGPDIMSRNFISKDEATAKKSAKVAGILLFGFSLMITFVGMWIRFNVTAEEMGENGALLYALTFLPKPVALLLLFGLLSAILSSTDTCIINASSIFVKDILKKDSVVSVRVAVMVFGGMALALVLLGRSDIMSLLSGAYSIYTPGVIFPLMIAILAYGKRKINVRLWLLSVITGGIFGITGAYFPNVILISGAPDIVVKNFTIIGMILSLIIAFMSVKISNKRY
ncbi:MAG: hypothetical protein K6E98_05140 [Lachnospiraceae bacterium]|nr:hypothetical protein [Lachnospiraceae bacterium]